MMFHAAIRLPFTAPCLLGIETCPFEYATSTPFFRSHTLASWIEESALVNWIEN